MSQFQHHANLNAMLRYAKAKKIASLLELDKSDQKKILEIGCGSGVISEYFACKEGFNNIVDAVDVVDVRIEKNNYKFQQIDSVILPFEDGIFDIVITNHVIEHVGGRQLQELHLSEIQRVLRFDGVVYLAVPNRWMLIEPHYRLIFLSWWPVAWRNKYLEIFRGQKIYDCRPLEMSELEEMLNILSFKYENISVQALRTIFKIEGMKGISQSVIALVPDWVLKLLVPIFPTLIYKLMI